ncbi:MAG: response regulator [Polyangiales bacterium]
MRVLVVDDSATIRRIVSTILKEVGYSVATSPDGADALDRVQREPFDLVLVDFVMPRLNGFQFAQAVRSISSLQALPIVLMSARAESIAERFVTSTGAAAWITKPFTPSTLVAVVESALARSGRLAEPEEDLDDDVAGSGPRSAVQPVPLVSRRVTGAQRAPAQPGEAAARALLPVLESIGLRAAPEALARALAAELTGKVTHELVAAVEDLAGPRAALEGRVEQVGLGEVLQLLALQKQTGVLRVERLGVARARSVALGIRRGRIDGCVGGGFDDGMRLGEFVVVAGGRREDVERVASAPRAAGELLGEALQREGVASAERVAEALDRQSRELAYECLGWTEGRFRFDVGASLVPAQRARLGVASDAVVMEAMRRQDEWRQMRELIPSDDMVLERTAVADLRADPEARAVLEAVDGARSVRALSRALAMRPFELCEALCRLLRANALAVAA